MKMIYLDKYNELKNDTLVDGDNFQWKLHMSNMDRSIYTKTTTLQCGKFRFDIEYYSRGKFFYIYCRYENNNKYFSNGTNRTVTLQQLKVEGSDNKDIYHAIREWKNNFVLEIDKIG